LNSSGATSLGKSLGGQLAISADNMYDASKNVGNDYFDQYSRGKLHKKGSDYELGGSNYMVPHQQMGSDYTY